ncbi:MAG: alpha-glucosidase/alpha-galactosidase [Granulosicoccus sp.]
MTDVELKGMHFTEDYIDVKIAYIGGGSLNWALKLMQDLAWDDRLAAQVRLYDTDLSAAQRNAIIGNRMAATSNGKPTRYLVSETLSNTLKGADIVIISILPGDFAEMAADIDIPARFGIPQSVGDTVGPGGFNRALRAIPELLHIGKAIGEYAPNAYVCNLSNPLSVLTGALYAAFPGIKAWGECHEVTKIKRQVAWLANQQKSEQCAYTHRDVQVNVLGINHFTFVDEISLADNDLWDEYKSFAQDHITSGWYQTEPEKDNEHARFFSTNNRVAFDIFSKFNIAAAAGDRHLAEFFPADVYLKDPSAWGFALTPVSYRIKDREIKRKQAEALKQGEVALKPQRSDEALLDQIIALMGGQSFTSNVNLPNTGQIKNLPLDSIVESNAMFSSAGIIPADAGALPEDLSLLVKDHAMRQTDFLSAVVNEDSEALLPLFSGDPLVQELSPSQAEKLWGEMHAATKHCLPPSLHRVA